MKNREPESLLFLLWYQYLNDQRNTQELNCFMSKGTIWESLSSRTLLERNDTYSRELFCVFNTCFPLYAFNQNRCTSRCSNNVHKNVNTFCLCAWYHWEQYHLMHKQAQLFPIEMKVQSANIMTQISRKIKDVCPYFLFKKQLLFGDFFRNKNTSGGLLHVKDANLSEESKQIFRYQCWENTFIHEDADNIIVDCSIRK